MIMTVNELKRYITTDKDDQVLEAMLQALEISIRRYTNNDFRAYRTKAAIVGGLFVADTPLNVGDTVWINTPHNTGLYTVSEVTDKTFSVNGVVIDEDNVNVAKVEYPMDVKMAVVDMMRWKLRTESANSGNGRTVQSESISRYSVTYATDSTEYDISSVVGVPKKYLAPLKLYKKARF